MTRTAVQHPDPLSLMGCLDSQQIVNFCNPKAECRPNGKALPLC